jgi:hypothetical protein
LSACEEECERAEVKVGTPPAAGRATSQHACRTVRVSKKHNRASVPGPNLVGLHSSLSLRLGVAIMIINFDQLQKHLSLRKNSTSYLEVYDKTLAQSMVESVLTALG